MIAPVRSHVDGRPVSLEPKSASSFNGTLELLLAPMSTFLSFPADRIAGDALVETHGRIVAEQIAKSTN
jgi:hypothetical protein